VLLLSAAVGSFFVAERSAAVIIGVIVGMSVGLGFVNGYRAEKAAEALHSHISHQARVLRDGRPASVDVTSIVPGDVVDLRLGDIVPADLRLHELGTPEVITESPPFPARTIIGTSIHLFAIEP
jgi:Mg2+-importing ATPase